MRYVICLDFGYPKNRLDICSTSIPELAEYTLKNYGLYPATVILAQEETYDYIKVLQEQSDREVDHINATKNPLDIPVEYQYQAEIVKIDVGQSNTNGLKEGGSYHVLRRARDMIIDIEKQKFNHAPPCPFEAILVAHRYHAPRAIKQGKKLGIILETSTNLPSAFHKAAAQWWCRNKLLWYFREMIGYIPLRLAGQI